MRDLLQVFPKRYKIKKTIGIGPQLIKLHRGNILSEEDSPDVTGIGYFSLRREEPNFRGVRERVVNKLRISQQEKSDSRDKFALARKGFTLVEIMIAVVIIGIMALVFYPNIINTLEARRLENSAREILTNMQRAKFQAVKTKLNHRVRFENVSEGWVFSIERLNSSAEWNTIPGFIRKTIPSHLNVNVNFPNQVVEFSPLGLVSNFSSQQNSITLQSTKLQSFGQPDERIISVFAGGSIQYITPEGE